MSSSSKKAFVTFGIVALGVAAVACSERIYMGEVRPPEGPPSFTDPSSADAALEGGGRLECIGTECPSPWTTCVSEDGPTYKCGTDLRRDPDHCGACGNKCRDFKRLHMTSRCVDGACEVECYSPPTTFEPYDWRNCNGLVDDGCEVDIYRDPKHCGACGNACAPGLRCNGGQCGCPAGKIQCDEVCVDPMTDDANCGGCGNFCNSGSDGCDPMPPRTRYGCANGACTVLKCQDPSADCNGDLGQSVCGGDGCEVESLDTTENCGACGIKCAAGLSCIDEGNGFECGIPCVKFGKVFCGDRCADLLTDRAHCGSCGAFCGEPGPNQASVCAKGICAYECAPGFGDCNGDPTDGCETNLAVHPANCGACGNECDIAAGQPCIEGACLMTECDGGVPR